MTKPRKDLLLVEDNIHVIGLLRIIFVGKGVSPDKILLASNGKEALILLGKYDVSAIGLDLLMPEMSGIQFLHEFDRTQHNKVVVFSCVDDGRVDEYPNVNAIFKKPDEMNKYVDAILELINKRKQDVVDSAAKPMA